MSLTYTFLRRRSFLVTLLFFGYLVFIQPEVLHRLAAVIDRGQADPITGCLLLAALIVESAGLVLIWPALRSRLHSSPQRIGNEILFLIWMSHLALTAILALAGLQALGVPIEATETAEIGIGGIFLLGFFTLLVLKEIAVLLAALGAGEPRQAPGAVDADPQWREFAGELLILPFSALGFTLLWEFVARRTPTAWDNPALALVDLVGWALFYAIAYLGARAVALLNEWLTLRTPAAWAVHAGLTLLAFLAALRSVPGR